MKGDRIRNKGKTKLEGRCAAAEISPEPDCAAQSLKALKSRISALPSERTPRGWEEPEACASVQLSLGLARAAHVLWNEQWRRGRRRKKRAGNGRCQVLMASLSAPLPVNSLSFSIVFGNSFRRCNDPVP